MATTYRETFNQQELIDFNNELADAILQAQDNQEAAMVGAFMFAFLGVIGGPLVATTLAATAAGLLADYYSSIRDAAFDAKRVTEEYEDLLQDHDEYDLVELQLTCDKYRYIENGESKYYLIPKEVTPIRIHTNSGGWIYV